MVIKEEIAEDADTVLQVAVVVLELLVKILETLLALHLLLLEMVAMEFQSQLPVAQFIMVAVEVVDITLRLIMAMEDRVAAVVVVVEQLLIQLPDGMDLVAVAVAANQMVMVQVVVRELLLYATLIKKNRLQNRY
jgi:hypothetical protein